jgi:hypothetical protein
MLLSVAFFAIVDAACPTYASIRQPAMDSFTNQAFAGDWYVQATNEPAVPNRTILNCPCNVYTVSLPGPAKLGPLSYGMKYVSACGDRILGWHNLTVPIDGYWNASTPGYHHENYVGARTFWPTMIFNASFGSDGTMEWLSVYACESGGKTSFQLLSRAMQPPPAVVDRFVQAAGSLGLDVSGLHVSNFRMCGWLGVAST